MGVDVADVSAMPHDIVFEDPPTVATRGLKRFTGVIPGEVTLKVKVAYENSLLKEFGGDHGKTKQWLATVMTKAKPLFKLASLKTKVNLVNDHGFEFLDTTFHAYQPWENCGCENPTMKDYDPKLRNLNKRTGLLVSGFAAHGDDDYWGVAPLDKACNKDGTGVSINELVPNLKLNGRIATKNEKTNHAVRTF